MASQSIYLQRWSIDNNVVIRRNLFFKKRLKKVNRIKLNIKKLHVSASQQDKDATIHQLRKRCNNPSARERWSNALEGKGVPSKLHWCNSVLELKNKCRARFNCDFFKIWQLYYYNNFEKIPTWVSWL